MQKNHFIPSVNSPGTVRAVSRIFLFFVNALFWASGDKLGLKQQANSYKQVAFAAGVQGKPKHCRTLKVAKRP